MSCFNSPKMFASLIFLFVSYSQPVGFVTFESRAGAEAAKQALQVRKTLEIKSQNVKLKFDFWQKGKKGWHYIKAYIQIGFQICISWDCRIRKGHLADSIASSKADSCVVKSRQIFTECTINKEYLGPVCLQICYWYITPVVKLGQVSVNIVVTLITSTPQF